VVGFVGGGERGRRGEKVDLPRGGSRGMIRGIFHVWIDFRFVQAVCGLFFFAAGERIV